MTSGMRLLLCLLACAAATVSAYSAGDLPPLPDCLASRLCFSNAFSDHAVLPRGSPGASVWGWAPPDAHVSCTLRRQAETLATVVAVRPQSESSAWRATFPPQQAGRHFSVRCETEGAAPAAVHLHNVSFGDLILCSGQSNMLLPVMETLLHGQYDEGRSAKWPRVCNGSTASHYCAFSGVGTEQYAVNGTAELERAAQYSHISLFQVDWQAQPAWLDARTSELFWPAFQPSQPGWQQADSASLAHFSAVCWRGGRRLSDALTSAVPLGLVVASQGASFIAPFMPKDACPHGIEESHDGSLPPPSPPPAATAVAAAAESCRPDGSGDCGGIFGRMLRPLAGLRFTAVWWYQGEWNSACHEPGAYLCSLLRLVFAWRAALESNADAAAAPLPFLVVQLAPFTGYGTREGVPAVRQAQAAAVRLLNGKGGDANSALVSAIDLGDAWSPSGNVHSMLKDPVGDRLAKCTIALARVYSGAAGAAAALPPHYCSGGGRVGGASGGGGGSVRVTFEQRVEQRANACPFAEGVASPKWLSEWPGNDVVHFQCASWELCCAPPGSRNATSDWVPATSVLDADGTAATISVRPDLLAGGAATGVRYAWAPFPVATMRTLDEGEGMSLPLLPAWLAAGQDGAFEHVHAEMRHLRDKSTA